MSDNAGEDYDVVLLIEQALSDQDAAQVHSLHEGLDQQVTYHVLLPLEDAAARRAELIEELQPLVCAIEDHPWGKWNEFLTANPERVPGTQSRWSQGKDLSFTPLRPERVLEVKYDHMEGRRFRHTAQFKRWRDDRDPESCGYEQLEEAVRYDLARVLGGVDNLPVDQPGGDGND